jgi:hypothetical protein
MSNRLIDTPVQRGPMPCRERGNLISKNGCYALRREDGREIWLEMDMIPLHLLDHLVNVEGARYPSDLIAVRAIGPA